MFNRLKTLTLMQLGNKYSFKRITDKKKYALNMMFRALSIIAVVIVMFLLFSVIKSVLFLPVNRTTFLFLLFISQLISILACTLGLVESLYYGKDNPILLSFPARHHEVFVSKLLAYYLNELIKNLYFVVPMFISFGLLNSMGVLYYLNAVVLTLLLSWLPVLLGAFLSIAIMGIKQLVKRLSWMSIVLAIAVMGVLFYLAYILLGSLERPIRLIEVYNTFVTETVLFMQKINQYALIYTNIIEAAFNINALTNYGIVLGVILGLTLIVVLTSMPIYFRMASFGSEHAVTKKHRHKRFNHKGAFRALLSKEVKIIIRSINTVVQDYILIIAMPLVLYVLNGFFWAMAPSLFGIKLISVFNILIALLLLTASNAHTASAISSEGSEFGLLKTAPSDTKRVAWAKMLVNFVVSTIFIGASIAVLVLTENTTSFNMWQIAVVLFLVNSGHILWSFQLDLRNPQLAEYSEKRDGAENINKSRSIIAGMAMAVFITAVAAFFMLIDESANPWWRIIGVSAGFFLLRLFLFVNNLYVYFREIEM